MLDLAEVIQQSPLDISRPLWTATLVEGLEGGKAASLLHLSHAVTDGVGATAMFAEIYDVKRDPPPGPNRRCRCPRRHAGGHHARGYRASARRVRPRHDRGCIGGLALLGKVAPESRSAVFDAIDYLRSGSRVVRRAASPSPLLRRRSLFTRSEAIEMAPATYIAPHTRRVVR